MWHSQEDGSVKFRFKEFRVYKDAKDYIKFCREALNHYFTQKDREIRNQIQRALISIVLNIAEGSADLSDKEFARFLGISIRSAYETVAAFDLATLFGYIDDDLNAEIENRAYTLVKQLAAFRNKLKKN